MTSTGNKELNNITKLIEAQNIWFTTMNRILFTPHSLNTVLWKLLNIILELLSNIAFGQHSKTVYIKQRPVRNSLSADTLSNSHVLIIIFIRIACAHMLL